MKKYIFIIILSMLLLSGCEYKPQNEVVFLNSPPYTFTEDVTNYYNTVKSLYDMSEDENTQYAFCIAFECYIDSENNKHMRYPIYDEESHKYTNTEMLEIQTEILTQKVVEIIANTELEIIRDYPFCCYNQPNLLMHRNKDNSKLVYGLCAVAGTVEQIDELFDGTKPIEGLCFRVWSAPRPDLLERIREAGWRDDWESASSWLIDNYDNLTDVLGEENQVIMKVDFDKLEE